MLKTILLVVAIVLGTTAQAAVRPLPAPPDLGASSYLLAEYHSGRILVEHEADTRVEPASITKVMTSYVIYQALQEGLIKRTDEVTISKKAWRMEGSRMFIEVGKKISVDELIHGMVIQSGNDATVALAEHVAGSEDSFVSLMNGQAQRLEMTGSHFMNVTGLPDPDHYTTAQDILKIAVALIRDFPEEYKLNGQRSYTFNDITQSNRNRLLWEDKKVDGIKTGHTESAGYCLVASAVDNDQRLISVVTGTNNDKERTNQSKALMNYGFRFFETRRLYAADQPVATARVWKGAHPEVKLGITQDLYVTYPRGQDKLLSATMDRPQKLEAPLYDKQVVGKVKVTVNGVALDEVPLVALNAVPEGGFFRRMYDSVMLMLE